MSMIKTKYWKVKLRKSLSDMTAGDQKEAFQTIKAQSLLEIGTQDNDSDQVKDVDQNGPTTAAAALSPAESVASARERLQKEEKVFADRKAAMKGEKNIGATKSK